MCVFTRMPAQLFMLYGIYFVLDSEVQRTILFQLLQEETKQLEKENALLKAEVAQLRQELIVQEIRNGGIYKKCSLQLYSLRILFFSSLF